MDEEYRFWDYCEGKKGECLQVETKWFDGYWYPDYDINEILSDRLTELFTPIVHKESYRPLNNKDKTILNKIIREYSLKEINELLFKSDKQINESFSIKEISDVSLKRYLEFITENIWPLKSNYTYFSGDIKIVNEQEEDVEYDEEVRGEPFTRLELNILKQLHNNFNKEDLETIASYDFTTYSFTGKYKKYWNVLKLFGIGSPKTESDVDASAYIVRASKYAKLASDNWVEDGDFSTVESPIRMPLKWYDVDREESGSQIEYKSGRAEVLGWDEEDANERADYDFYSWGGEMETMDYGDYEIYDSEVVNTEFMRMDESYSDNRTKALISIGGIQRDKLTSPDFIKNILNSSGHKAMSSGLEDDGDDYSTFYTPGTNIDLETDLKRIRDRIRFEEYGDSFKRGVETRGSAFEGMLAGLFNGETIPGNPKEDIEVGGVFYSIKQANPGDAWDTGSLMGGYNFAVENMVKDDFSEEEIPPTPVALMVAGNEYIQYKAQMLTESFKTSKGIPLKWIFAHVLDGKHIEYDLMDSEELISAILSSDCSQGTGSQSCAVGISRKSDTGIRIKSRFVLGNPKMITFPTVSEEDIRSIIYDPEGNRIEDKIRRIFKNPNKVSQYTVDYIRDNPKEFQDAVNAIIDGGTLTNEEIEIAQNILTEQSYEYSGDEFNRYRVKELTPQIFKILDDQFTIYPHEQGELVYMEEPMALYSYDNEQFVPLDYIYQPILDMIEVGLPQEDMDIFMEIITDWANKEMSTPKPTLNEDDGYVNDMVYRDQPLDKHIRRMGRDMGSLSGFPIEEFMNMPPPENESEDTEGEIEYLETLPVDKKLVQSADEIASHFSQFLNSKGLEYPKEGLKGVMAGVRAIILKLKYHYNRPRPFQIAKAKGLELNSETLESSSSPSYPSGHAAQGRFIGRFLSDLYPDYEEELTNIGDEIAYSRNMTKVHYPSDSKFGKLIGDEMYEYVYQPKPELEMELDEYCPMGKPNKCTEVNYSKLPDTLQESFAQVVISKRITCEETEIGSRSV
tara:strand:- start:7335 stop:10397 length:3063 start_codon:yes stop_codon:yes gene_type:complete